MITIGLDGEKAIASFAKFPKAAKEASRLSVISAARYAHSESAKEIFGQVNLLKGYISDRLTLKYSGSGESLAASITGRFQPTSLSRFTLSEPKKGKVVRVRVKRNGQAKRGKYFAVKLRQGSELTDIKFNVGLAIRVKPGQAFTGSDGAKLLRSDKYGDTYLLYGPSINQIFRGVSQDLSKSIEEKLADEFERQLLRLGND